MSYIFRYPSWCDADRFGVLLIISWLIQTSFQLNSTWSLSFRCSAICFEQIVIFGNVNFWDKKRDPLILPRCCCFKHQQEFCKNEMLLKRFLWRKILRRSNRGLGNSRIAFVWILSVHRNLNRSRFHFKRRFSLELTLFIQIYNPIRTRERSNRRNNRTSADNNSLSVRSYLSKI